MQYFIERYFNSSKIYFVARKEGKLKNSHVPLNLNLEINASLFKEIQLFFKH